MRSGQAFARDIPNFGCGVAALGENAAKLYGLEI